MRNGRTITKVYSIPVDILFHAMAANGMFEVHWYVTPEHEFNF